MPVQVAHSAQSPVIVYCDAGAITAVNGVSFVLMERKCYSGCCTLPYDGASDGVFVVEVGCPRHSSSTFRATPHSLSPIPARAHANPSPHFPPPPPPHMCARNFSPRHHQLIAPTQGFHIWSLRTLWGICGDMLSERYTLGAAARFLNASAELYQQAGHNLTTHTVTADEVGRTGFWPLLVAGTSVEADCGICSRAGFPHMSPQYTHKGLHPLSRPFPLVSCPLLDSRRRSVPCAQNCCVGPAREVHGAATYAPIRFAPEIVVRIGE